MKTSNVTFLIDMVDRDPVIGGLEIYSNGQRSYTLHIGRTIYKNQMTLGKILIASAGSAVIYIPYNNTELTSPSFEVLIEKF